MPISRRSLIGSALAATVASQTIAAAGESAAGSRGGGKSFDVRQFGAIGDASADDSLAIQRAVRAAESAGGGSIYLSSGNYRVASPIVVLKNVPLDLVGDGQSSLLLWDHPGHAIWWRGASADRSSVANLRITSVGAKNPDATAIRCDNGCVDSTFSHLWIDAVGNKAATVPIGIYLGDAPAPRAHVANPILNVAIESCYLFDISRVGLSMGAGGEVRVSAGRYISSGPNGYAPGSIAIHLRGGMGGFHLTDTDVSIFEVGLQIGGVPGGMENREIFITHATLDSCRTGLMLCDNSYVSIAGCWAASSREEQILVRPESNGKLVIVGGTIFNGGHNPAGNLAGGPGNGLVMRGGSLVMTGVDVRSNIGKPIDLSPNVRHTITGCLFEANGQPPTPPSGPPGLNSGW